MTPTFGGSGGSASGGEHPAKSTSETNVMTIEDDGRIVAPDSVLLQVFRAGFITPSPIWGEGWGEGKVGSESPLTPPLPRGERGFATASSNMLSMGVRRPGRLAWR
jgi:hypothetical protein